MQPPTQQSQYRPDIDGLRAVAVLLVVFFHTDLGFRGGYVGVDVFFVISGFLITGILLRELQNGSFSFAAFWERRIRRIIPAMVPVLLAVVVAGYVLMTSVDFQDLANSLRAQSLLVANFYFLSTSGYFDGASYEKPLLHTWSLAVEEQFYLLLPILLFLLFRLRRGRVLGPFVPLALISFLIGLFSTASHPNAAYYLLPARAWELLLGAALAAWTSRPRWLASGFVSIAGTLSMLVAGLFYTERTAYPGVAALAPCLGAAAVILGNSSGKSRIRSCYEASPMVFIGRISYSVYLWHWPIVAFIKYRTSGTLSTAAGLLVVFVSLGLASLSWKYVETPFRKPAFVRRRPVVFALGALSMGLAIGCGTLIDLNQGFASRFPAKVLAYSASRRDIAFYKSLKLKDAETGNYIPLGRKAEPGKIDLLVWGDSHAMFTVPPLRKLCEAYSVPGAAFTRSATPPALDYVSPTAPRYLARDAIAYNKNVLNFAVSHQIKSVLLAAFWIREFERGSAAALTASLLDTVQALQKAGLTVYFLRNVPVQAGDVPRELARATLSGVDTDTIGVTVRAQQRRAAAEDSLVEKLRGKGVIILDPIQCLSDANGLCRAEWNGKAAYWDQHHLSSTGAMRLVPLFEALVKQVSVAPRREGVFNSVVANPSP
jgi:peptidoglycan/LPS O-acetylase OafA/YrhL